MAKRILFVLAALLLAGAGYYYRTQNAKDAKSRADQVARQDLTSSDTATQQSDLKSFVAQHMGASVSYTLAGSYARAEAAAKAAALAQAVNSQIYAEAQRLCSGKSDSITQARCNQDYLSKHLANIAPPTPVPEPKLADYKHSLKAPIWTPDLAGALSLGALVALLFGIFGLVRRRR